MNAAVKQTRTYPAEFTVTEPDGDASATFHGADASKRAVAYAAYLNASKENPADES